jgi:hypothetical protein
MAGAPQLLTGEAAIPQQLPENVAKLTVGEIFVNAGTGFGDSPIVVLIG